MSFLRLLFRVSASASSVFFRVIPWLILMLRQPSLTLPALISVFLLLSFSVFVRG